VRKVFADLGIEDVETEAQTLSGFLVEQFGSLPVAGSELDFRGHRFTVTKATNKRAERVRVQRLSATEEPAS
jgi:CBS domain containing-hemolysin-like protein